MIGSLCAMKEFHDDSAPAAWAALGPLMDLVTPMALRVAATLRIADLIDDDAVGVDALAERSGTDADALARLLRHLVAHGVFAEPEPGRFSAGGPARFLRSDHPAGMHASLDLDGFGGQMDLAFTGLLHTVRTGEPAWETVFGKPFWQYLADEPHIGAAFDATMATGPEYFADAAAGYDWTNATHVVDVGGGIGALLAEVLNKNHGLRATLVDLPDTVRRGGRYLAERGMAGRCEFAGQSFFDPLPTGGDIYLLSHVVHDWSDDEAVAILRRCAEAAGEHGRVLIIEGPGTANAAPAAFAEMNLRMLVLAGGRQRELDDYRALAGASGLRVTDTRTTPLGHDVIECVTARE
jgi:hypothetical protein